MYTHAHKSIHREDHVYLFWSVPFLLKVCFGLRQERLDCLAKRVYTLCARVWAKQCMCERVCMCVSAKEREREREREM